MQIHVQHYHLSAPTNSRQPLPPPLTTPIDIIYSNKITGQIVDANANIYFMLNKPQFLFAIIALGSVSRCCGDVVMRRVEIIQAFLSVWVCAVYQNCQHATLLSYLVARVAHCALSVHSMQIKLVFVGKQFPICIFDTLFRVKRNIVCGWWVVSVVTVSQSTFCEFWMGSHRPFVWILYVACECDTFELCFSVEITRWSKAISFMTMMMMMMRLELISHTIPMNLWLELKHQN